MAAPAVNFQGGVNFASPAFSNLLTNSATFRGILQANNLNLDSININFSDFGNNPFTDPIVESDFVRSFSIDGTGPSTRELEISINSNITGALRDGTPFTLEEAIAHEIAHSVALDGNGDMILAGDDTFWAAENRVITIVNKIRKELGLPERSLLFNEDGSTNTDGQLLSDSTRGWVRDADVNDPPFCFPESAQILVGTNGECCKISEIGVGDTVMSFDANAFDGRGALVPKKVTQVFRNVTTEWLETTATQDDLPEHSFCVTPGHNYLNESGHFESIEQIASRGGTIFGASGGAHGVKTRRVNFDAQTAHLYEQAEIVRYSTQGGLAIEPYIERGWATYNFEVEDYHTYIADGFRVHNDSQAVIDVAGSVGRSFGTQLGQYLTQDESQFVQIAAGTALGVVTQNLAEIITDTGFHLFDGSQLNFGASLNTAFRQLNDVGTDLFGSASGAVTSFLVAELGESLGLEGFGAELFNFAAGTYAGSVVDQVASNVLGSLDPFSGIDWVAPWSAVGGAAGAFFGSYLARQILPANSIEGSIGGSLGSIVGASVATSVFGSAIGASLGVIGGILLPGVGAFIGTLLGTFLGDLFGDDPVEPFAAIDLFLGPEGGEFYRGLPEGNYGIHATTQAGGGFPNNTANKFAGVINSTTSEFLRSLEVYDVANASVDNFTIPSSTRQNWNYPSDAMARVLHKIRIEVDGSGNLEFFVNGVEYTSAQKMIDAAVTDFFTDVQPIGGNLLVKRAIANSVAEDSITLSAHMAAAAEYEKYLSERDVVNALIASQPNSVFAAGWAIALAQAQELGLAEVSESDFNGGLAGFLASLTVVGLKVDPTDVRLKLADNGVDVLIEITVDDPSAIPASVDVFAEITEIIEVNGETILRFIYTDGMSGVGYDHVSDFYLDYQGTTTYGLPHTGDHYIVSGIGDGRSIWFTPEDATADQRYAFTGAGANTISRGEDEITSPDDILIGGEFKDFLLGHYGRDWIDGGGGDDYITGGSENDILLGGDGNDLIFGGSGRDYIEGGAGADEIYGGSTQNPNASDPLFDQSTLAYTSSNAAVTINLATGFADGGHATGDSFDFISGIVGSDFDDTLIGDAKENFLEGGAGADVLDGGLNPNDQIDTHWSGLSWLARTSPKNFASYTGSPTGVTASLADSSINTGHAEGDTYINIDALEGSEFDDVLVGDDQNNKIWGGAGNDLIILGTGMDIVDGGFGFDTVSYREYSAGLTITVGSAQIGVGSADVINNRIDFVEAIEGTAFDDTMVASAFEAFAGVLLGGDGNDTITGSQFRDDHFYGNNGDDVLSGGEGDDRLFGGDGTDTLTGGNGDDFLDAGAGDGSFEYLYGEAGSDTYNYSSGGGKVFINIHAEADHTPDPDDVEDVDRLVFSDLVYADFNVSKVPTANANGTVLSFNWNNGIDSGVVRVAEEGSRIEEFQFADGVIVNHIDVGTSGIDTLIGTAFGDLIDGLAGDDDIRGEAGNDRLLGGDGKDIIRGGDGNDFLDAGAGDGTFEYLYGEAGSDTYNYSSGGGKVFINIHAEADHTPDPDDVEDVDRLVFSDLVYSDFNVTKIPTTNANGTMLAFNWNNGTDSGVVRVADEGNRIEEFQFADGVVVNHIDVGTSGIDTLIGTAGRDLIDGFAGDDDIRGEGGDDRLFGGDGKDIIRGGAGDDILDAGAGDGQLEQLIGQAGNDTYLYSSADRSSVFLSNGAENANTGVADRFIFTDLGISDVTFGTRDHGTGNANGVSIEVQWDDGTTNGLVRLANSGDGIEEYQFADGVTVDNIDVGLIGDDALVGTDGRDLIDGFAGDDDIRGEDGDDRLFGGDGKDIIRGGAGDDILDAGAGDGRLEQLIGQAGNDTYLYSSADGSTVFLSNGAENANTGGADRFLFTDLGVSDVTFGRYDHGTGHSSGVSIEVRWDDGTTTGLVRVANSGDGIEEYQFSDGVIFDNIDVGTSGIDTLIGTAGRDLIDGFAGDDDVRGEAGNDRLLGGDGKDIIRGGDGNDFLDADAGDGSFEYLYGEAGSDTYNYSSGGGKVFINIHAEADHTPDPDDVEDVDRLVFSDLVYSDFNVTKIPTTNANGTMLAFNWNNGTDSGVVSVADEGNRIEEFQFADGVVVNHIDVGTSGIDTLIGTAGRDLIDGFAGDDDIRGEGGDDRLFGGDGKDVIRGGSGNDVVYGGDDNDSLIGNSGNDRLYGGNGHDVLTAGENDNGWQYLYGQDGNDRYRISDLDGKVFISGGAENATSGTFDRVMFLDLNQNDLTISYHDYGSSSIHGNAIIAQWDNGTSSGELRIANEGNHIEQFEFANGSTINDLSLLI